MSIAISALLSPAAAAAECATIDAWWPRWRAIAAAHSRPFERAVAGGAAADRLGWAFASGYQAALRALDPTLPDEVMAAFCVTEAEGNFPRAIHTTLAKDGEGFRVSGEKRWATLGPDGGLFIVVAREAGGDAARPSLKAVKLASGAAGLSIDTMPSTAFVPEVPHARVRLEAVRVEPDEVLPGDAYLNYVKPFRTIEDIYIHSATIAYLGAEARARGWPRSWRERGAVLLVALEGLAALDPLAPQTHVALAGAFAIGNTLIEDADALWEKSAADPGAQRWMRDRAISGIAAKARAQRLASAWAALG